MRLVNKQGHAINVGDIIHDFRDVPAVVLSWNEPRHSGSSGYVNVRSMDEHRMHSSCYVNVYNLEWSEL